MRLGPHFLIIARKLLNSIAKKSQKVTKSIEGLNFLQPKSFSMSISQFSARNGILIPKVFFRKKLISKFLCKRPESLSLFKFYYFSTI